MFSGAGSGIGRQIALTYAKRKCNLILFDLNDKAGQDVSSECTKMGARSVSSYKVDVCDEKLVGETVADVMTKFSHLDCLVLCAGIGAHHTFTGDVPLNIFKKCMEVNFFGYLHVLRACHEHLLRTPGSRLIAITSFSGEVGLPYRTAYCASKFAATGLLESLRSEMATIHSRSNTPTAGGRKSPYSITIVCPPTVDTNLRKNSVSTVQSSEPPEAAAMTVEDCAGAIVTAGDWRLRKAFFPAKAWLASYLRPLVPDLIDASIQRRAKL